MHILVMHRVPDSFVRYRECIDHDTHDVTYVSVPDRAATLPADVRARRIQRCGTGDTAAEVLAAVESLPKPDMVIALSEYDLLPAAQVREALCVPGAAVGEVLPSRDKVVMKSAVAESGLRVPRFSGLGETPPRNAATFPWRGRTVLKPLSGASSEGVTTHPTAADALTAAARTEQPSGAAGFEIEEFIDGPIIHVDGLMAAGELAVVQASRYVGTCLGYAQGRPFGSVQIGTEPKVADWTRHCLRAVGIDNGPFHLEGIEAPDGLVFLEVGARFGGADVVDTFALATGVHLPSAQVRLLVEGRADLSRARTPEPDEYYGWFVFPGHRLGSPYCRISGEQEFRGDPLVRRWVQRAAEEPVKNSITYADAEVPLAGVVGPAPTRELERFLTAMFASVRVEPLD